MAFSTSPALVSKNALLSALLLSSRGALKATLFFFLSVFFNLNTVGTLQQHNPMHVQAPLPPPGPAVPRELGAATLHRPGPGCGTEGVPALHTACELIEGYQLSN